MKQFDEKDSSFWRDKPISFKVLVCTVIIGIPALLFLTRYGKWLLIVIGFIVCSLSYAIPFVFLYLLFELFSYHKHKQERIEKKEKERMEEEAKRANELKQAYWDSCWREITDNEKKEMCAVVAAVCRILREDYQIKNIELDKTVPDYVMYNDIFVKGCFNMYGVGYSNNKFEAQILRNSNNEYSLAYENGLVKKTEQDKQSEQEYEKLLRTSEKKPNPNIAKARAKRKSKKTGVKQSVTSGTFIGSDGKRHVEPDWKLVAKTWVSDNVGFLNKILCEQMNKQTGKTVKVTINAAKLPQSQAWSEIGNNLVAGDEIDSFTITDGGLLLIIER